MAKSYDARKQSKYQSELPRFLTNEIESQRLHSTNTHDIPLTIISGGQTGVDRGALDWAISIGLNHGGACPLGRRSEDGKIPSRYQLTATDSRNYLVRTACNIKSADATLLLHRGEISGGTKSTIQVAKKYKKPLLIVHIDEPTAASQIAHWLDSHSFTILNIAGPRESKSPGIQTATCKLLHQIPWGRYLRLK